MECPNSTAVSCEGFISLKVPRQDKEKEAFWGRVDDKVAAVSQWEVLLVGDD